MSESRRSSLVLGCNNSRDPENGADGENEGRYDCRQVYSNFELESDEGGTAEFRCGSWDCYCCGYRMRMNLVEEIQRVCRSRPEMRRLLTLTLDPSKAPDSREEQHEYLTRRWNALRTELVDKYGGLSFIWVREEGEEGDLPHLHIIVNRYIPQGWLSSTWAKLGGGEVVDIRRMERVEKAAHYVGKYLTKNALSGMPEGIHRYGSSSDIDLAVRSETDSSESWTLMMDDWGLAQFFDGEPLRRGVSGEDFVRQREWGGPKPPPMG